MAFRIPGLDTLSNLGTKLYNAGAQAVSAVTSTGSAIASGTATAVSNAATNTASALGNAATGTASAISSTATQASTYATTKLKDAYTVSSNAVSSAATGTQNYAKKTLSDITSYQPTYTPHGLIVAASDAINALQRIHNANAGRARNNDDEQQAKIAALEALTNLISWLAEEGKDHPLAKLQEPIKELVKALEGACKPPEPGTARRTMVRGSLWDRVTPVQAQLNYWAKSSIINRMAVGEVLPPLDSDVMKPLNEAFEDCILLRESLNALDNEEANATATEFATSLKVLIGVLETNSLPAKSIKKTHGKLSAEYESLMNVVAPERWHESTPERETVTQITDRLLDILSNQVKSCAKTDSKDDLLARAAGLNAKKMIEDECALFFLHKAETEDLEGSDANQAPKTAMPDDYRELLKRLEKLENAIQKNPDDILNSARSTCAFIKAMLEEGQKAKLDKNNESENDGKKTPEIIKTLTYLSNALERAVSHHKLGYCDPTSPNYVFKKASEKKEPRVPSPTHTDYARFEVHCLLAKWKNYYATLPKSLYELGKEQLKAKAFGPKPKQADIPNPPKELLARADALFVDTMDADDRQDYFRTTIVPQVSKLLPQEQQQVLATSLAALDAKRQNVQQEVINRPTLEQQRETEAALYAQQGWAPPETSGANPEANAVPAHAPAADAPPVDRANDEAGKAALLTMLSQLREKENEEEKKRVKEENNQTALSNGGLAGTLANAALGAAKSAGITNPALDNLAKGGVQLVNQFTHGTTNADAPPKEPEKVGGGLLGAGVPYVEPVVKGVANVAKGLAKRVVTYPIVDRVIDQVADTIVQTTNDWANGVKPEDAAAQGQPAVNKPVEKPLAERVIRAGADYLGAGALVDMLEEKPDVEGDDAGKKAKGDDAASLFRLHAEAEDAANFNSTISGISVSDKEISEEKDLFISNNTNSLTMQILFEYVCGCKVPNVDFYNELIEKARAAGPTKEYDVLKEGFIAELEKAGVGTAFASVISWILFPILHGLLHHYWKLFAKNGLEWAKEFIANNNKDGSNSMFANNVADRLSGFLATLQAAYGRVATNKDISGNLPSELDKELSKPQYNYGMSPKQLHQAVADQLISTFIEPGVLQVSQTLREACANWHPFEGSIADTALNSTAVLLSWVATVAIYPVEWIVRKLFLNILVSKYVVNGELVKSLVTSSVGSIKQNGYTHALNCVLYDQLKYIYVTLQRHYNSGSTDEAEESVDLNKFSIVDRGKLTTIVQEIFNLLEKHQCNTPEELKRFLEKEKSWLNTVKNDIEYQFVYSKVVKSLEELIGAALHTFLEKGQLERQFYQLLTTVNSIYKKGQEIPASEYQRKEDDINRVIDSLLTLVIDNSLNEVADFDREHEQVSVDAQLQELTDLAKDLYRGLNPTYAKLNRNVNSPEDMLPYTPKIEDQLHEMITKSSHFLGKVIEWKNRVQSPENSLSREAKDALVKIEADLRDQIDAMVKALSAIYLPRARMSLREKMTPVIDAFKTVLEAIIGFITGHDTAPVSNRMEALKKYLLKIDKQPALKGQAYIIRDELKTLENLVEEKKLMKPLQKALDNELNPENSKSALRVWLNSKKDEDFDNVKTALSKIAKSTAEHQKIMKLINQMRKDGSALKDYREEWEALRVELREKQEKATIAADRLEDTCKEALNKCIYGNDEFPDEQWMCVDQGMKQLKEWLAVPASVTLAKDTSFLRPLKEKGIKYIKNCVTDRVRNKSTGVLSLIRDPILWHHGLYNHNLLFPFIGKN